MMTFRQEGRVTAALRAAVQAGKTAERQRDVLREAAAVVGREMADRVGRGPFSDQLLPRRLQTVTGPYRQGRGYGIGVAPFSQVGDPDQPAPRGTIKAFLAGSGKKWRYVMNKDMRAKFSPKLAWWYLPREARLQLNLARLSGHYGGKQGARVVPAYWKLQETGAYPAPAPRAQRFVQQGIAAALPKLQALADRLRLV